MRLLSDDHLPEPARAALERARALPMSYGVRRYVTPGDRPRTLVVLGEAHMKMEEASKVGHDVVDAFGLRGVETFQTKKVFAGRMLAFLLMGPRRILRALSFGRIKDSTIVDAKQLGHGFTVEIEKSQPIPFSLHVGAAYLTVFFAVLWTHFILTALGMTEAARSPFTLLVLAFELHFLALLPAILLRRHSWAWLIHPVVAIVTVRDRMMANGTVQMLSDHPEAQSAVVVMGRAHLPGFERELVDLHGFRRLSDG
ncbi:MAG: hypothetical protein JWM74_4042 [Myxococcaceae bacterium]|nr:hypothetical protein [Myxococcaceae bacterium]